MKYLVTALLALFTGAGAHAEGTPSPQDLFRTLSPSVWLVGSYDADKILLGTGSAVVTGPETLLTNCHVIARAKHVVIRNDNVQHDARLQYLDVERDLCQITARNLRAPAVRLGDSDALAVGQKVFALGNPRGLENTLSDGLISALRRHEDTRALTLIQTSAPISPGSSGGGLFDAEGRLIGITTAQMKEGQNLNFAIPINWARELPARSDAALRNASLGTNAAPPPQVATRPPGQVPELGDVAAVPVTDRCRDEYRKFLATAPPRAFAITTGSQCIWQNTRYANRPQITTSPDPAVRAMELCVHWYGSGCSLYAVDQQVVWKGPQPPRPGALDDIAGVPVDAQCREEYRKFIASTLPRAFAVAPNGKCAWQRTQTPNRPEITSSPDPAVRAMALCKHWHGEGCKLYAVDGSVVYQR